MKIQHKHIDAAGQSLGRVATKAALLLRGKHLPTFNPAVIPPVTVTITGVKHLRFTGQKLDQKRYYHFSGYPGGLKSETLRTLFARSPERVVRRAVRNMLPANRLRDRMMRHLTIEL